MFDKTPFTFKYFFIKITVQIIKMNFNIIKKVPYVIIITLLK